MNKIKIKSIVALVLLFSLCICFIWGHARQASDYTTEQHIQRMYERIEKDLWRRTMANRRALK